MRVLDEFSPRLPPLLSSPDELSCLLRLDDLSLLLSDSSLDELSDFRDSPSYLENIRKEPDDELDEEEPDEEELEPDEEEPDEEELELDEEELELEDDDFEEPEDEELSLLSESLTFKWRASDKLTDEPPPLQCPLRPLLPRRPLPLP